MEWNLAFIWIFMGMKFNEREMEWKVKEKKINLFSFPFQLHSQINHSFPFPSANLWRKLRKELMDLLAPPHSAFNPAPPTNQFSINPKKRQLFVFLFVDWWDWLWSGLVDCCCLRPPSSSSLLSSQPNHPFSKNGLVEEREKSERRHSFASLIFLFNPNQFTKWNYF